MRAPITLRLIVAALASLLTLPGGALAAEPTAANAVRAQQYARIVKPHGAAIRTAPDGDAPIVHSSDCGDLWPVLETRNGWVRVTNGVADGWIGGARVALGSPPPFADCSGGRSLSVSQPVWTYVPTGCLSLRALPSRSATMLTCVANGHQYTIVNGPVDPGTGEDWFEVYSPRTGLGWVLADHLLPT